MRPLVLGEDSPVVDKEHPPGVAGFSCYSEDALLFGIVYYAEGRRNPTAVFCHGFPGMEKNYDLAHILRQAGFNVVIFSYRGAWGSHGSFSFSGVDADVLQVVSCVREGRLPYAARFDPDRLVLIGHSMGAFAVLRAGARMREIRDVALLAVWNIGCDAVSGDTDPHVKARVDGILMGARSLSGTSRGALWNEMRSKADAFDLSRHVSSYGNRRVLMVGAEGDEATPPLAHHSPLCEALRRAGADLTEAMLPGDHLFSATRFAVARILLKWLFEGGY